MLRKLASILIIANLSASGSSVLDSVFAKIVSKVEYQAFWFDGNILGEHYKHGARISALVFQGSSATARNLFGLCSVDLQQCICYSGEDGNGPVYQMRTRSADSTEQAFHAFLDHLNGLQPIFPGLPPVFASTLGTADFEMAEGTTLLPVLSVPKELEGPLDGKLLDEARNVWTNDLKPSLFCPAAGEKGNITRRQFLFARRAMQSREWFVGRRCEYEKGSVVQSVHRLSRADFDTWALTSGGYMGTEQENPQVTHTISSIRRVLLTRFDD